MSPSPPPAGGSRRRRERDRQRADERLFSHLGAIHRLDEEDLALLEAIAATADLRRRSDIFVRPSRIVRSPEPDRWPAARVRALAVRLGEPPPAARGNER